MRCQICCTLVAIVCTLVTTPKKWEKILVSPNGRPEGAWCNLGSYGKIADSPPVGFIQIPACFKQQNGCLVQVLFWLRIYVWDIRYCNQNHANPNDTIMSKQLLKLWMGAFLVSSLGLAACETDDLDKAPVPKPSPATNRPPANPPATNPPPANTPSTNGAEAGTVTGKVVDSQGRPVAGAKVRIENDFYYFDVTTDAQGVYKSPALPTGGFKAVAWARIAYKGQTYTLRMGMAQEADYDFFDAKNGVVRDFKWQLNGRIPDREAHDGEGYFGGTVSLSNGTGSIFDERMNEGDQVLLTLNPTGPLIDGSTGQRLERSFTIKSGNESYKITDIPAGEYEISAVRVVAGTEQEPLLIGTFSQQWQSARITFQPDTYGVGNYESGLQDIALFLKLNR